MFTSCAFAETHLEKLNLLFQKYSERFDSGKYVSRPEQIASFNKAQDYLRDEMLATGALKKILTVNNDYEKDLVVSVYAFSDERGNLLALYREKSKYYDDEERSFLRFTALERLSDGIRFIRLNSGYAVELKGYYFNSQSGGTLRVNYLTNLNQNTFSYLDLFVVKNKDWEFVTSDKKSVSGILVKTWKSLFPPNGGVKELVLN